MRTQILTILGILIFAPTVCRGGLVITDVTGIANDPLALYIEGDPDKVVFAFLQFLSLWEIDTPADDELVIAAVTTQSGLLSHGHTITFSGLETNDDWSAANLSYVGVANQAPTLSYSGGDSATLTFLNGNFSGGDTATITFTSAGPAVPEPSSCLLFGLGSLALIGYRKRMSILRV
jgi:hypothetical protein